MTRDETIIAAISTRPCALRDLTAALLKEGWPVTAAEAAASHGVFELMVAKKVASTSIDGTQVFHLTDKARMEKGE